MCDNNNTQSIADYLAQLLKDKKQLAAFPNVFLHLERLLDDGKTTISWLLFWKLKTRQINPVTTMNIASHCHFTRFSWKFFLFVYFWLFPKSWHRFQRVWTPVFFKYEFSQDSRETFSTLLEFKFFTGDGNLSWTVTSIAAACATAAAAFKDALA